MDPTVFEVIERLSEFLAVQVNSSSALVEGMGKAAAAIDRERAKKGPRRTPTAPASRTSIKFPFPSGFRCR